MYIHSHSRFVGPPADDVQRYKEDVSRYTQLHFRRANRFVLLAMAGACRCVQGRSVRKDTAVYLTTENGNLGDTEVVLDQIFHKRQFPLPYNFINTMSNTASFYVAQSLQLESLNITFSSKQFSFERGLELLRCDLLAGAAVEGLIGGVDEACFSQAQFEAKYQLPSGSYARVEGSCWLLVSQNPDSAVGEIKAIESFSEMKELLSWIGRHSFEAPVKVGFGVLLSRDEQAAISGALPQAAHFDYLSEQGYFDSATACAVSAFLEQGAASVLVHINKDAHGQFMVLAVAHY